MNKKKVIPIHYLLIDDPVHEAKATVYHLLDRSLVYHLRSFMTMMLLPADTLSLDTEKQMFSAAFHRLTTPPSILRAPTEGKFEDWQWAYLKNQPVVILVINGQIPKWGIELANLKPVGLLSPSERVLEEASKMGCFQIGLLQGFTDVIEAYRVIGELISRCVKEISLSSEIYPILIKLSQQSLYENRPRLGFIEPIPLPRPNLGRPAAFLLNRLSNNVDKPSLYPEDQEDIKTMFLVLPRILDYSYAACLMLSGVELGLSMPSNEKISKSELDNHYTFLSGDARDDLKRERWFHLGERITGSEAFHSPLMVSVPAARMDLFKDPLPSIIQQEPGFKKAKSMISKALSDYMKNQTKKNFKNKSQKKAYDRARETILSGHRLLAVQTACLGMLGKSLPIQTHEIGGSLYSAARDLNTALKKRTHKISKLFREFEIMLAESLPKELLAHLALGNSNTVFYSDLPYEWTMLDNWPVCLTRPVSRIPMSATDAWINMIHSSSRRVEININKPDRVLVLDLIDENDPIRHFSELFRKTSDSIGQIYTYRKPSSVRELKKILDESSPEIVVLDTHGKYREMFDELFINLGDHPVKVNEFIPDTQIPPVWILSACDMSVTGALRGSMIVPLLKRGAVCVIGTVQKIDAMAAAIFVGRLLTDIYSPPPKTSYTTLLEAFFISQLTTALLYDPLLPLLRKARPGTETAKKVYNVIFEYIQYFSKEPFEPRSMRYKAGEVLHENIMKQGLLEQQIQYFQSGEVTPETLLFTAFGLPSNVDLIR